MSDMPKLPADAGEITVTIVPSAGMVQVVSLSSRGEERSPMYDTTDNPAEALYKVVRDLTAHFIRMHPEAVSKHGFKLDMSYSPTPKDGE